MSASDTGKARQFEILAKHKQKSLVGEFWGFLKETRKWWLLPLLIGIVALGAAVIITGSPIAPFLYPFF